VHSSNQKPINQRDTNTIKKISQKATPYHSEQKEQKNNNLGPAYDYSRNEVKVLKLDNPEENAENGKFTPNLNQMTFFSKSG
jgi:hypothetical protein